MVGREVAHHPRTQADALADVDGQFVLAVEEIHAGAFGQAGLALGAADAGTAWSARLVLFLLANLMLVALGLYLMGATPVLTALERLGQGVWRRVQPFGQRFLPATRVGQAFPLGLVWGWLPCGLVYGALFSALGSGSAAQGAG